ncbi:E3 ubiquitin-protein ligase DCST1-like isoform X2 [Ciona intestinalis]
MNNQYVAVGSKPKSKSFITQLFRSNSDVIEVVKILVGSVFGAGIGYGYYYLTFSGAFQEKERVLQLCVLWAIICMSSLGCALSVQIRCIAALSIPTMVGKTGRSVLGAVLATWILAGPIANVMYHSGEAVNSLTCTARMHNKQMMQLLHLLHAPVTAGFRQLVDDAVVLNDTEKRLNGEMETMKGELWSNDDAKPTGSTASGKTAVTEANLAGKLKDDAVHRCTGVFEYGVDECVRLFQKKEQDCHDTIKIPFLKDILCLVLKTSFLCNIVRNFNTWCDGVPAVDEASVNQNYSKMNQVSESLNREFESNLLWKVPRDEPAPAMLTVDEIVKNVESDIRRKKEIFDFCIALVKKVIGISFIFVLSSSSSYNSNYLTDFRFDNLYVTTYFKRKDKERKVQGKRCLLPLSRLEKRHLILPTSLKLTINEKKSVFFKMLTLFGQFLFTVVLLMFDYVIYVVLDLIRRHAKVDVTVQARHKLEVHIEGNKTVAALLKRLFLPFKDNDHAFNTTASNLGCLPVARQLPNSDIYWIVGMYGVLLLTTLGDAYALRLRHVVASLAYRRREKNRIIFLYSDVMRRRKNHLYHVRMTVQKLAQNFRLRQRHSILTAMRVRSETLDKIFAVLGIGSSRCLICEVKETKSSPLVKCDDDKCHVMYCTVCWGEVGECCWACKNYKPQDETLQDIDDNTENMAMLHDQSMQ